MKIETTFTTFIIKCMLYTIASTYQSTIAQQTFPMSYPSFAIEKPSLIYTDDNNYLFIEQNDCFYAFERKPDIKTNSTPFYYLETIRRFSLNESGVFDLKEFVPKSRKEDFGIICLMDFNADEKKDLIVFDSLTIYSLENKGNKVYGNLTKLMKIPKHVDVAIIHDAGLFTFLGFEDSRTIYNFFDLRDKTNKKKKFVCEKQAYLIAYLELKNDENYVVRNNYDGSISFIGSQTFKVDFTNYYSHENLGVSDFNNDGLPDIVSTKDHTLFVHYGQLDKSLKTSRDLLDEYALIKDPVIFDSTKIDFYNSIESAKRQILEYLEYGKLDIVDMNNDEYVDIIYHGEFFILFLNNRSGGFDPIPIGGPFDDDGYIIKDFNGDKLQDILINAYNSVYLFMNRETVFEEILISKVGYTNTLIAIDADSDNDTDILFTDGSDKLKWLENKGDEFSPETQWIE